MLNMCYENWLHLMETKVICADDEIEGMAFGGGIVIADSRIPKDYLNKRLCFTGSHGTVGPKDELYRFFYKKFQGLECLCNNDGDYSSYICIQRTLGNYSKTSANSSIIFCLRTHRKQSQLESM
mgnify:CR=1 FL=1